MLSNPFRSGEFYHLSRANIQAGSYKFGVTSLESDRWISCRDEAAVKNSNLSSFFSDTIGGMSRLVFPQALSAVFFQIF